MTFGDLQPGRTYQRLDGDKSDLQTVATILLGNGVDVALRDGIFYVSEPGSIGGSQAQVAADLIDMAKATYMIHVGRMPRVFLGGPITHVSKGKPHHLMVASPVHMRITVAPVTLVVTRKDGSIERRGPLVDAEISMKSALASPELERALLYLVREGTDWPGLSNVWEALQAAGLDPVRQKFCSKAQASRFRHTANSAKRPGERGRHARGTKKPPANPMSIEEATALVHEVLRKALSASSEPKGSQGTASSGTPP